MTIMTSKGIYCIRSETENDFVTDLNIAIRDKSNVLDIKIFDRGTYWVAFVIYSIKKEKELEKVWKE